MAKLPWKKLRQNWERTPYNWRACGMDSKNDPPKVEKGNYSSITAERDGIGLLVAVIQIPQR